MDDPNITMEEYIRLEEEKARRHGQTFNWQTATFGNVKNYEDKDKYSINFETEFLATVFDNTSTTIPSEPTVCPPNKNKLDFRISLDESDDEDYMDLKTEFPAIVYNDGLTSKSDFRIKPLIDSKCINEINLIDETSLSEYDEETVSHFNNLFNDIHPNDLKSEKDDDDNDIAVDQRHPWLRYQIEEYTKGIRHNYEQRLETIWSRPVNRVHVLDFEGLTVEIRRRMIWRQFILALGLHTELEMAEAGFGAYWAGSDRSIPDKGDLRDYWLEISFDRDFLGPAPSYVLIRDPVRRLCHRMIAYSISGRGHAPEKATGIDLFYLRNMDRGTINVPHLLAQYLFRHAEERKSGARLSGWHFIGRLAMHFGLVSDDGLRGLQAAAAGADKADKVGHAAEEAAPEISAPTQTPPPPPPIPQPRTMSQRIKRLEEVVPDLRRDVVGL
ncbi:hypothetical protein Tco_1380033 [Tanacetum coccineum]